jgi:aspartyl/asparaginyl-tRNA synthetase
MEQSHQTEYITVDLEIRSNDKFEDLINAIDKLNEYAELYQDDKKTWSTNVSWSSKGSPNKAIKNIYKFYKSLKGKPKHQWINAFHVVLNIGYDTSSKHWAFMDHLSPKAIKMIAKMNAGLSITLYPKEKHKSK